MKNSINWQILSENEISMKLSVKGFFESKFTKLLFYFCAFMLLVSLIFTVFFAFSFMVQCKNQSGVFEFYITLCAMIVAVGFITLHHFYKIIKDNNAYYKEITIDNGLVSFVENTREKKIEWAEKLKKYSAVALKHFKHNKQIYWHILLLNDDNKKSILLFLPSLNDLKADEAQKRELLARIGTKFNLGTQYEKYTEKEE